MEYNSDTLIEVGRVGKPVGLKGMCRVFPMGDVLNSATLPVKLLCGTKKKLREVEIVTCKKAGKEMLKATFTGFNSCDEIDVLKNSYLYLPKEALPEVAENEYYFYQLQGLAVYDEEQVEVGKIVEIYNFPTTDAIEIVLVHSGEKILYPFRKETVKHVSVEDNEVVVYREHLQELM